MAKDFLPIGSVVQLAGSDGLAMVAGYLPIMQSRPDHVWDYSGFRFPIGYTDDEGIFCFDHSQVKTVYAYGYMDIEEEIFSNRLASIKEQIEEKMKSAQNKQGPENGEEA